MPSPLAAAGSSIQATPQRRFLPLSVGAELAQHTAAVIDELDPLARAAQAAGEPADDVDPRPLAATPPAPHQALRVPLVAPAHTHHPLDTNPVLHLLPRRPAD